MMLVEQARCQHTASIFVRLLWSFLSVDRMLVRVTAAVSWIYEGNKVLG